MPDRPARDTVEGPEAADRFTNLLRRVVSVPKDELIKREAAYQHERKAQKPGRKKR
jgi:hypothetical protein